MFCELLLDSLIRILTSDYLIIFFTAFFTAYFTHMFITKRERDITARNKISNIAGLLYLIRMSFYQRYEAELYSNYYEQRGKTKKAGQNFDKKQEELQNSIMREKSEDIYKLYKDLHKEITELKQVKSLSTSTEERITNILNYKTLVFPIGYKEIKDIKALEEYKKIGLKLIKSYIKELQQDSELVISSLKS
jgi:hypothetical protein